MRFVSLVRSVVAKARRGVAQSLSIGKATEEDSGSIAERMRQVMLRVNKLEAASLQEAVEFEVVVSTAGAAVELMHNIGGPVRWYVTKWMRVDATSVAPVGGHSLVESSTSTNELLVLNSYVAGRAVVRVEPSKFFVEA